MGQQAFAAACLAAHTLSVFPGWKEFKNTSTGHHCLSFHFLPFSACLVSTLQSPISVQTFILWDWNDILGSFLKILTHFLWVKWSYCTCTLNEWTKKGFYCRLLHWIYRYTELLSLSQNHAVKPCLCVMCVCVCAHMCVKELEHEKLNKICVVEHCMEFRTEMLCCILFSSRPRMMV